MELKYPQLTVQRYDFIRSNCTFMELKLGMEGLAQ